MFEVIVSTVDLCAKIQQIAIKVRYNIRKMGKKFLLAFFAGSPRAIAVLRLVWDG